MVPRKSVAPLLALLALIRFTAACTQEVTNRPTDDSDASPAEPDPNHDDGAGGQGLGDVDWGDQGGSASGPAGSGGQGATPLANPQPSRLVEVPLGQLAADSAVPFAVTEQTLGFTTIIHSPTIEGTVGLKRLEAPNGDRLVDDFLIGPPQWEVWWYGTTVASVPQTDAPSAMPRVMPGSWSLIIGDPVGTDPTAEVTVWRRETEDGAFHGGWLDINVLIAGSATTESYLRPVIEQAFHGYAGLHLGTVEFFELADQYAVVDEYNFDETVRQTAMVTTTPALNVIVVADFTGWLEGAAGVAAGIPGQAVEHGTNASAVMVEYFGDAAIEIDTLRHEAGHLAGLFHTTEFDDLGVDPLADTPECDDVMQLWDCPDATNLMFPIVMGGSPSFTAQQHRVIEGSTLYRAELVYAIEPPARAARLEPGPPGTTAPPAHPASAVSAPSHRASWAATLDSRIATLLAGGWCAPPPPEAPPAQLHQALHQLGAEPWQLLAVGSNPDTPAHVRKRALRAAGRLLAAHQLTSDAHTIESLEELARRRTAPRAVRLGALGGLRHAAPERGRALAASLQADSDPVVATLAQR